MAYYDVVVVGSGLAGVCAAVSAAEGLEGKGRVLLASAGETFSGSSFYRGTWGLGLVSPASDEDAQDLVESIEEVGCGAVDRSLVESFVAGIEPAVRRLEAYGVRFRVASSEASEQEEYIPCFDRKHRRWRGLECATFSSAMGRRLHELGVTTCGNLEVLDLLKDGDRVTGAVFYDARRDAFQSVGCASAVLAAGGAASLFSRRLTSADCRATAQALAVDAGARLVNMEFIQFMPGLVRPRAGLVFNEKTFRFMALPPSAVELLGGARRAGELLELRSGYGPFTSRLESREIDFAIDDAGDSGLAFRPDYPTEVPEFVRVYDDWLQKSAGIDPAAERGVAMYAHASNGGIAIDAHAGAGVAGLYAAGECTGGMHGADRIGGLSAANCIVFGQRAGASAASYALEARGRNAALSPCDADKHRALWAARSSDDAQAIERDAMKTLDRHCVVRRNVAGLEYAAARLDAGARALQTSARSAANARAAAITRRVELRLATARAIVAAAAERRVSCGSHCVVDDDGAPVLA